MSARKTKRSSKGHVARYWGYLLLAIVIYGWTTDLFGPAFVVFASSLSTGYMLFQAPMWCMARNTTNGEPCSNNASGLLLGCWIRKHKWDKFKMIIKRQRWAEFFQRSWSTIGAQTASIAALGSMSSAIIAALTLAFKK